MSQLITVVMDLPPTHRFHLATVDALHHAITSAGADIRVAVERSAVEHHIGDGVVIGPGSPYEDPSAVDAVIKQARERGTPLVGT